MKRLRAARPRATRRYARTHRRRDGHGREPRSAELERVTASAPAPVTVNWKGLRRWLGDARVRRAARAALAHGGRPAIALSVVLVGDRELARLHGRWLGDPTRTDVITFDLSDDLAGPAGEIYAGAECARRVAARRGTDPGRELLLYVVHGALHLCGFDDRSAPERARMRRAEAEVMKSLGYAPERGRHDLGARAS